MNLIRAISGMIGLDSNGVISVDGQIDVPLTAEVAECATANAEMVYLDQESIETNSAAVEVPNTNQEGGFQSFSNRYEQERNVNWFSTSDVVATNVSIDQNIQETFPFNEGKILENDSTEVSGPVVEEFKEEIEDEDSNEIRTTELFVIDGETEVDDLMMAACFANVRIIKTE